MNWCKAGGAKFLLVDCDGDDIPDPVCSAYQGNLYIIQSSTGCSEVGPPNAVCKSKQANKIGEQTQLFFHSDLNPISSDGTNT